MLIILTIRNYLDHYEVDIEYILRNIYLTMKLYLVHLLELLSFVPDTIITSED